MSAPNCARLDGGDPREHPVEHGMVCAPCYDAVVDQAEMAAAVLEVMAQRMRVVDPDGSASYITRAREAVRTLRARL